MASLFGGKLQPIEFGEGALRFVRKDNAFHGVQLRRRRPSKGQSQGRSFPGVVSVCLHGLMIAQTERGLKPGITEPACPPSGPCKTMQSDCKQADKGVIAVGFYQDCILQSPVCSIPS